MKCTISPKLSLIGQWYAARSTNSPAQGLPGHLWSCEARAPSQREPSAHIQIGYIFGLQVSQLKFLLLVVTEKSWLKKKVFFSSPISLTQVLVQIYSIIGGSIR